jgi:hypothetical protein
VKGDMKEIRNAIYDLIWQTAYMYKDAPGGKLSCPRRTVLERYVNSKIMIFDFMLQKAKDRSEVKNVIENFLKDLEDNFKASVYETKENLSYYQERKRECLEVLSRYIDERITESGI